MKKEDLIKLFQECFGNLNDKQILALTIYGEARGESRQGRIAVGTIILERVEKQGWMGKSIPGVCLCPYQFSCYLPSDPNFSSLKQIAGNWDESYLKSGVLQGCYAIASGLIDGTIPREPVIAESHATHYKTLTCKAAWESEMKKVATIGHHDFYA